MIFCRMGNRKKNLLLSFMLNLNLCAVKHLPFIYFYFFWFQRVPFSGFFIMAAIETTDNICCIIQAALGLLFLSSFGLFVPSLPFPVPSVCYEWRVFIRNKQTNKRKKERNNCWGHLMLARADFYGFGCCCPFQVPKKADNESHAQSSMDTRSHGTFHWREKPRWNSHHLNAWRPS